VDEDLEAMTRKQLIAEVRRLRAGIRTHRDSTGHALCLHHPALWGLLPEKTDPLPTVPRWPEFLRGCVQYRRALPRVLVRGMAESELATEQQKCCGSPPGSPGSVGKWGGTVASF
jgi:hypothetical protein